MSTVADAVEAIETKAGGASAVNAKLGLLSAAGSWAQLGAFGITCFAFLYLLIWEIPSQRREAMLEMRTARQEFISEVRAIRTSTENKADQLGKALNELTEEVKRTRTGIGLKE